MEARWTQTCEDFPCLNENSDLIIQAFDIRITDNIVVNADRRRSRKHCEQLQYSIFGSKIKHLGKWQYRLPGKFQKFSLPTVKP